MKLFAVSKNGKMLKLGTEPGTAEWFFMTDELLKGVVQLPDLKFSLPPFKDNDDVEVTTSSKDGKKMVSKIAKAGEKPAESKPADAKPAEVKPATPAVKQEATGITNNKGEGFTKAPYLPREEWEAKMKAEGKWKDNPNDKGTDINNSIKRQAIMHAVSRAMIGLQGTLTPDNMEEISEKLYKKFQELVG